MIATGARYRRLDVERLEEFEGTSVHYWASPLEADLCAGQEVALVGGGNSAGQAMVFLASRAGQRHDGRTQAAGATPCRTIWSSGSRACPMSRS